MRLLVGPPGSGKTTHLLEEVRARLRDGRDDFRVLAPTSTMAAHVRNQLAREGFLFRPSLVTTLHGFVDVLDGLPPLSAGVSITLAIDRWLDSACPPPFQPLRGTPGLRGAIESALEEIANAGCDSLRLEALEGLGVRDPHLAALRAGLSAVEAELGRQGAATRTARLLAAARSDFGQVHELFVDGFFTFLPAELELLRAAAARMPVTVTLPSWPGVEYARAELLRARARETVFNPRRAAPRVELLAASSRESEVMQVARGLLAEHAAGRPWMDFGVILRSEHPYAPLLETTLARLGIPVRSYFAASLRNEPSTAPLLRWLQSAAMGFDAGVLLRCLRHPALPFSTLPRWPEIERSARERLPFSGLDVFLQVAAEPGLEPLREWSHAGAESLPASEWSARMHRFCQLVQGPHAGLVFGLEETARWQRRAAALRGWREALDSAAAALGEEPLPIARFAQAADAALDPTPHYPARAGARDCVHLMGVYEARQWELPVVFICGLVEGEFPARESADALIGEDLRLRMRQQGVPVVLPGEQRQQESFLLDLAFSRATERLILSWPRFNAKGEPVQRAYALDRFPAEPLHPARADIRPSRAAPALPRSALETGPAREALVSRYEVQRPTWIETFLQCPFQFFARHTLELEPPAEGLLDRLSPLELGTFAHDVLDAWHRACSATGRAPEMGAMFDAAWGAFLRRCRIPDGFEAEAARATLRRGLIRFSLNPRFREGWMVETEQKFRLELAGVTLSGRIDRLDRSPSNHVVLFDFKLTTEAGLRERIQKHSDGALVQGGLYAKALERQGAAVDAVYYVPLRGVSDPRGWDEPDVLHELMERSVRQATDAQFRILQGVTAPAPLDPDRCSTCDFVTACRWVAAGEKVQAVGG